MADNAPKQLLLVKEGMTVRKSSDMEFDISDLKCRFDLLPRNSRSRCANRLYQDTNTTR